MGCWSRPVAWWGALLSVVTVAAGLASAGLAAAATVTFGYTSAAQQFVVPPGVTSLSFDVLGAGGGGGAPGGRAFATIAVTPGETLQINVGGTANGRQGGFNGGGFGGFGSGGTGFGGGGASDVRQGGTGAADRVIVAGGGGGRGGTGGVPVQEGNPGGAGGGLTGGDGTGAVAGQGGQGGAAQAGEGFGGAGVGTGATRTHCIPSGGGFATIGLPLGGGGGGGGGYSGGGGGGPGRTVPMSRCFDPIAAGETSGGGGGGGSGFVPAGGRTVQGAGSTGHGSVTITYEVATAAVSGATFYTDGTSTRTGPTGARVSLFATSAEPGFSYRLVSGRGTAQQPCSVDVQPISDAVSFANAEGVIGQSAGAINRPAGEWQICFLADGQTVTGAVTYTVTA